MRMTRASTPLLLVAALGGVAAAQADTEPIDVEVPSVVIEGAAGPEGPSEDTSELDLANVVQSAAKGVTTVQEAPAIVTVITAEEIRQHQYQFFDQIIDRVPGWYRVGLYHSTFTTALVRGQTQAVQFLHDGTSLFDPAVNVATLSRLQPVETIKRIELITGPGGVLWGSNSLLGILNVITKDADDVDGVEVGGTVGHGDGDREMARAYAMVGMPNLAGGKLKLFAHGSVETYAGPSWEMPLLLFHQPLPQPNAPNIYGPLTEATPPRSLLVNLDAKLTWGKLQLRLQAPFTRRHTPMGLSGTPVQEDLPQDGMCPEQQPFDDPSPCVDRGHKARDFELTFLDRYAVLEYRTRFADQKAGLSLKGYAQQFVRRFDHLAVLAPSIAIKGGLSFAGDLSSYRTGGALDGDVELGRQFRVLYGVEGFHEWTPTDTDRSLQGEGTQATFPGPYNLERLPLLCPRELDGNGNVVPVAGCPLTLMFQATRTVFGAYVNPQWRPNKKLIVDVGARIQVAPGELGQLSYDPQPTFASALVYELVPNWHAKLNFAQGFRPPVLNNTNSNGEAVTITGNKQLEVETSDAYQAELNARIFKGERRIRELSFRADYSYTRLENLIQVGGGKYVNSADRAINSAELLAKLFVQGGHSLELGYTWLRVDTADRGRVRSTPEHWFNLSAVFNVIDDKLTATTGLRVAGASEDPNRLVEYRDLAYDEMGNLLPSSVITVNAAEVVMDRLPPIAELALGVTYMPTKKLLVRGTVFNALNGRFYQPDAFFDYEPHLEFLPNPYEDFRAYVSAAYQY